VEVEAPKAEAPDRIVATTPQAPEALTSPAPLRNVILITLDTVRADALGCYGQELPSSPALDRMAAEGVRFEQVVSSAPSTLPSHASILTGKQPYAHGARANAGYALAPDNVSLAEVLREHGYRTGAEIAASVISRQTKLDQGFESYRDPYSRDANRRVVRTGAPGKPTRELTERDAREITDRGIEFLREHRDEPMFLWLHYFDAHRSVHSGAREFAQDIPESRYHASILSIDRQIDRL
jgi:arylsulfatase A-like enzyme